MGEGERERERERERETVRIDKTMRSDKANQTVNQTQQTKRVW